MGKDKSSLAKDKVITLSPTSINTWIRCRKSFYWKYTRKLYRANKESPLELGTIASEIFAAYYSAPVEQRSQQFLVNLTLSYLKDHHDSFLGFSPNENRLKEWNKIVNILRVVFSKYFSWSNLPFVIPDSEIIKVVEVETFHTIPLTKNIFLKAKPDAVISYHDHPIVFEHKFRSKYSPGDFGIDYQSIASCLVTGSEGTLYNVVEYSNLKLHRDLIIRTESELSYFKDIMTKIGEDILSTSEDRMYPQPLKRCSCSYWELCLAEFRDEDINYLADSLYGKKEPYVESIDLSDVVDSNN